MTRTTDKYLTLTERTNIANKWGANYFLSVHINAGGGIGYEDFIYNGVTSAATKNNQKIINAEVIKATGWQNRGMKRANLAVVRQSSMPAILTENGFIDRKEDANKLKSDSFLNLIAKGHAEGLAKIFNLKRKKQETPKKKGELTVSEAKKINQTIDKLVARIEHLESENSILRKRVDDKIDKPSGKVSPWAEKDWERAVRHQYFDGTNPRDYTTREQVAKVINTLVDNLVEYHIEPLKKSDD